MASVLVTGGARSGKSRLAMSLVDGAADVVFVATATPGDDDMAARIQVHRRERPPDWRTIEEPIDPAAALETVPRGTTIVLDCLTLWTSNLLLAGVEAGEIVRRAEVLAEQLTGFAGAVVVTNEVGSGIVPDNHLARDYRDVLGRVNVAFSDRFERVLLAVAGRAVEATRP